MIRINWNSWLVTLHVFSFCRLFLFSLPQFIQESWQYLSIFFACCITFTHFSNRSLAFKIFLTDMLSFNILFAVWVLRPYRSICILILDNIFYLASSILLIYYASILVTKMEFYSSLLLSLETAASFASRSLTNSSSTLFACRSSTISSSQSEHSLSTRASFLVIVILFFVDAGPHRSRPISCAEVKPASPSQGNHWLFTKTKSCKEWDDLYSDLMVCLFIYFSMTVVRFWCYAIRNE
jgi:hypothetical protein